MNIDIIYTLSSLLIEKIFHNFLRISFLIILICFLFQKYKKRRFYSNLKKFPALKTKFYQILGDVQPFVEKRFRKVLLPAHLYDCFGINGIMHIFYNKGIVKGWQADHPVIFVYRADLVETILSHGTELKKAWFYRFFHPVLGTGLLTSDGDKWRYRRRLLTKAFHFNILKDFTAIFNKHSKVLVSILEKHTRDDHVEIVSLITHCSLDIICGAILDKKVQTQIDPSNPYFQAFHVLASGVFERMLNPLWWPDIIFNNVAFGKRFNKHKHIVHDFTIEMIQEKKKLKLEKKMASTTAETQKLNEEIEDFRHNKKTMIDILLDEHLENNNSVTVNGIREEIDTFIAEGHDTTSIAMSWALYLIGLHPWVQEKVHEELDAIFDRDDDRGATEEDLRNMKYLECVLKEAVRLYCPVPLFGREIVEDLEIGEYVIPKGSTCLLAPFMLHRDPVVFPNPEKFDPDRFTPENSAGRHPFAYVPFSAGPRNCIGQRFAMIEEKTIISTILRKFKIRSIDPRDKVHPIGVVILTPYNGLRLQIRRRDQDFDFPHVYYRP